MEGVAAEAIEANTFLKGTIMKIILPINGDNPKSKINTTFGRAERFIVVDLITNEYKLLDNVQNLQAAQGAGIQSAQNIVRAGADVLITMHLGPKAYSVLNSAGVKMMTAIDDTIENNLKAYKDGKLKQFLDANVEGHWV